MPRQTKLRPIFDKDSYSEKVFEEIDYRLYTLIFKPLLDLLRDETGLDTKLNAKASLLAALKAGRIQYQDGHFVGQFSAAVSRDLRSLGATWDKTRKDFKLDLGSAPSDVKVAVSASREKSAKILSEIKTTLRQIETNQRNLETHKVNFETQVDSVIDELEGQFQDTTKKITAKDFAIQPDLPDSRRAKLRDEYTENMDLYIKEWEEEAIVRLREKVEEHAFEGFRSKDMIELIQAEYGVSQNKARFLARQETSLLVSKYREDRYQEIGCETYQWSTSHDARVRHRHEELDGRVFRFDDPPIVDLATGRRANPGEDFQCRCVAIPIFEEQLKISK